MAVSIARRTAEAKAAPPSGACCSHKCRLDQLQLHDPELALVVRDHVDAGINGLGRCRRQRLQRKLDRPVRRRAGPFRAAEMRLHSEVAALRTSSGSAWLNRPSNSMIEYSPSLAIEAMNGCTSMRRPATSSGTASPAASRKVPVAEAETGGFTTSLRAAEAVARLAQRMLVQRVDGDGVDRRNALSVQLGQIGLVAVPAQQGRRVDAAGMPPLPAGRAAPAIRRSARDSPRRPSGSTASKGVRSPGAVHGRALTSNPLARSASASTWNAQAQGSG